jgi:hypothetical protein
LIVGPSQDQAGSVVKYEVAFVFKNEQRRLEGKIAIQLTVEIQGDPLAITSVSPKIKVAARQSDNMRAQRFSDRDNKRLSSLASCEPDNIALKVDV